MLKRRKDKEFLPSKLLKMLLRKKLRKMLDLPISQLLKLKREPIKKNWMSKLR